MPAVPFSLSIEYIYSVLVFCLPLPSRESQNATLVAAESGSDAMGRRYGVSIPISTACVPYVAYGGDAKEVPVPHMGESLTSHNRRTDNDVRLRHLPQCRVLQESY